MNNPLRMSTPRIMFSFGMTGIIASSLVRTKDDRARTRTGPTQLDKINGQTELSRMKMTRDSEIGGCSTRNKHQKRFKSVLPRDLHQFLCGDNL